MGRHVQGLPYTLNELTNPDTVEVAQLGKHAHCARRVLESGCTCRVSITPTVEPNPTHRP